MTIVADTIIGPKPGVAAAGRVEFRNVFFRDNADHTKTVAARTEVATLASDGAFSIELEPGPYVARRIVSGGEDGREYPIEVPASGTWRLMVLQQAYSGAPSSTSAIAALLVMLDSRYATSASVSALLGGVPPESLDSIAEIATALGGDPQRVANLVTSVAALTASVAAKYAKPSSGIPKADLETALQNAVDKANASVSKTSADASYAPIGGAALPAGGTTGQLLVKTSTGAGWTNPPTGGGGGVSVTDNANGTASISGSSITDNGNGTATIAA